MMAHRFVLAPSSRLCFSEQEVLMGRKGIQLTIGLLIIAGGLVALAGVSFKQNLVYYITVGEYLDRQSSLPSQGYRVNGKVVQGSVVRASEGVGVTFAITDGSHSMPVVYARELPDTFKEGGEVVIEGAREADGNFHARSLLAKCPSKYEKMGTEHPKDVPMGSDSATTSGS
jgi:cytochrome c-type biogenesis protein CcmE